MQIFKQRIRIVAFFAILIGMLGLFSVLATNYSVKRDNWAKGRNKSIIGLKKEPKNSIDVVFAGDSLCYSAFSPMQLWKEHGIPSYVCGQSAQRIQETYHMLEEVFQVQKPKVVVLETNTLFRPQTKLAGLKKSVMEECGSYFSIFQLHDIWKAFVPKVENKGGYYKGFYVRSNVEPYKGGFYMGERKKKKEISPVSKEYVEKIHKLCMKNHCELLLVSSPSPKNYCNHTYQTLTKYAKKQGLKHVELNLMLEQLGIDWETDAKDKGDHLNISGAQKVTQYMGDYLATTYQLPNHRLEIEYRPWDRMSRRYERNIDRRLKRIRKEIEGEGNDNRKDFNH